MDCKQAIGSSAAVLGSAALLTLIQPPWGWSAWAWLALVPFVLACITSRKTVGLLLTTLSIGTVYWAFNLTWLIPCTAPGWMAFSLYLALLWPLMALALRLCHRLNIPMSVACAVIFVGAERLQGVPLGGFFWRQLCHSQFQNVCLIQIADLCGASGVSLLIALTNGLLVDLWLGLRNKHLFAIRNLAGCLGTGLALSGAWLYGHWRISQTENAAVPGPLVAAVQSNVPQSVKDSFEESKDIFAELLDLSDCAIQAGADLVAWPETMVQAIMDTQIQPVLQNETEWWRYDQALRHHAKDRTHLLIGAYGGRIVPQANGDMILKRFNSAFMYCPDGTQYPERYDKIHLVLFGETMPFRKHHRWLYHLLMRLSPYDYDYSLDAGNRYTVFTMKQARAGGSSASYHFGTIICYEDTIPYLSRNFVLNEQGAKQIDWLVNISNDGWFVRFEGDHAIRPSAELAQHTAACVFRAVENRVAILRSVNSGISCLVDSCGRLRNSYVAASSGWPRPALNRQAITGWFVDRLPIDKRISFYTKHGQWLDNGCALGFGALVVLALVYRLKRRKACVADKDEKNALDNGSPSS